MSEKSWNGYAMVVSWKTTHPTEIKKVSLNAFTKGDAKKKVRGMIGEMGNTPIPKKRNMTVTKGYDDWLEKVRGVRIYNSRFGSMLSDSDFG